MSASTANTYFTAVKDLTLTASELHSLSASAGLPRLKEVSGVFTPTTATDYPVLDGAGDVIQLPTNAVILGAFLFSDDLAGGTSVQLGLAASTAGVVVRVFTDAVVNASVLLGSKCTIRTMTSGAYVGKSGADPTNTYLAATTVGTNTAGSVKVRVLYYDVHPYYA